MTATPLMETPLTPLCAPDIANTITSPEDFDGQNLFRSYRAGEWPSWFAKQKLSCPDLRGPIFASSVAMAEMAARGHGIALLPSEMFKSYIQSGRLVTPFTAEITTGRYWLTCMKSREKSPAMAMLEDWLVKNINGL
nr:LysR substrate-binding domain-containing protein [Roseovarius sp. M141]